MDMVKEAFQKVKQEMDFLKKEIEFLKFSLIETREKMIEVCEIVKKINGKTDKTPQKRPSTQEQENSTTSTHTSTDNTPLEPLNTQNLPISTGNQGVPTDRQTDRQTDRHTPNESINQEDSIDNALKVLDSLDTIKKEIRLKFKRLTEQEILVFSTLYQLDEEHGFSDYKTLSQKLKLTESSVRDYVGRLIKKGIPVDKKRINNKNIQLSISPKLKKIASLPTILQLRDL